MLGEWLLGTFHSLSFPACLTPPYHHYPHSSQTSAHTFTSHFLLYDQDTQPNHTDKMYQTVNETDGDAHLSQNFWKRTSTRLTVYCDTGIVLCICLTD